ncbi:DUF4336 domain-containing protein [Roseovarius sp.]|jgi:hypothetical protein
MPADALDIATGYEPLDTLKPVADGVWLIDGPALRCGGVPVPTRATVIRLENGDLWVHSPTRLSEGLRAQIEALGSVAHIIAPNRWHHTHMPDWQAAFPRAQSWAAPGVADHAARRGHALVIDHVLKTDGAEAPWAGQIDQMILGGSRDHREAVFLHRDSRTLILTDLIQAFETAKLPVWTRPIIWIAGVDDSDGSMPPRLRWRYRDKVALAESLERMIAWAPERVILAHGRWYERRGTAELERAFRRLLRHRRWDRALSDMKKGDGGAR